MGLWGKLFGGCSEARKKAEKYEKLEKKLGEKLDEVNSKYNDAENGLKGIHSQLTDGPGEAEGKIMTDFTDKEGVWSGEYRKILSMMQLAKMKLVFRKDEARMKKEYWESRAELEEMEGEG